jgi:hypothetical protein
MEPNERAIQLLEDRKKRITDFSKLQPNHPFTLANKHMLELSPQTSRSATASAQTSWSATGTINMTGVLWWAVNFSVALAPPNTVIFNATGGPSADFAIFTSVVTGFFYLDPSTIGGEYNFTMQAVSGGIGEVTLDLYDMNWSSVGSFVGAVGGISASYISGSGTMTYY